MPPLKNSRLADGNQAGMRL